MRQNDRIEMFDRYVLTRESTGWRVTKTGRDHGWFFRGTSAWAWCLNDRRCRSDECNHIRELDRQIGFLERDIEHSSQVLAVSKDIRRRDLHHTRITESRARRDFYSQWLEKYLSRTKYLELRKLK